jgi:hypothetical protein
MSQLTITPQQLQASFEITETAILEIKQKAESLTIKGLEDKEGYKAVDEARKLVKEKRVKVEKTRKALNEDALAYQRTVNAEAKRITALLEPIEENLEAKTKAIDEEKERIKQDAIRAKQAKIAERIGQLAKMEMTQLSGMYYVCEQRISHAEVEAFDDDIWEAFIGICQKEFAEKKRIEAEEKAKAEAEALRVAEEKEKERLRVEAETKALEAKKLELEQIQQAQKAEAERLEKLALAVEAVVVPKFYAPKDSTKDLTPQKLLFTRANMVAFANWCLHNCVPFETTEKDLDTFLNATK